MESDNHELKLMRVSVVLLKDDQIKYEKEKAEKRQQKLFLEYKNKKNLFIGKKSINSYKSFNKFSPNNTIYNYIPRKISLLKNFNNQIDYDMQFQTTLSSFNKKKKFKTPYQILHLKDKTLKNIFDNSRNYPKIPSLEKDIKKKLKNMRTYSNYNNIKYQSYFTKPNYEAQKLEMNKNIEKQKINNIKLVLMKGIKKDIKINPHILSFSSNKKVLNTINSNENNRKSLIHNINDMSLNKNLTNNKIKVKNKPITKIKPNCYFNKLNLKKISKILRKYTYIDN